MTLNTIIEYAPPQAMLLDIALKSLLVLAAATLAVCGMKRCSATDRHFVLFLAVTSLLALPLLSGSLPGWHMLPRWMNLHEPSSAGQNGGRSDTLPIHPSPAIIATGALNSRAERTDSAPPATAPWRLATLAPSTSAVHVKEQSWTLWQWAWAVWLTGACCALLPTGIGLISLWRLEQRSRHVDAGPSLDALQKLSDSFPFRRRVALLITAHRRMPMTWGAFRPKLLLPEESCDWSEDRRRVVVLHELAHVQRWDYLTNLVTQIACALYWFNPLVWLAARQMRSERELACYDMVLREGARPAHYAEEVLQIAAGLPTSLFEAYGAIAMARPSSLEGRLLAILDGNRNRRTLTRTAAMTASLLLAVVLIPLSMMRAAPDLEANSRSTSSDASNGPDPASQIAAGSSRGLVAWWRAEGNGKDSAGTHDGQFPFGARYTKGVLGQAFDFRRSYAIEHLLQRVSVPDSPAFKLSESMTLEAWVNPRQYGGIILLRGDDRGGFDTWQLDLIREGYLSFAFNDSDNKGTGVQTPIPLNQWQHVVAIFDRGAMKLYINAVLVAQAETTLRPIDVLDADYDPALGIGNAGGKLYNIPFDGLIDEVRIYNRALSDAEIAESLAR